MKLGTIGFACPGGEQVRYSSDRNLLDFDLLIWNPQTLVDEFPRPCGKDLHDRVVGRRHADFNDFFAHGRNLVVLLPPPVTFIVQGRGGSRVGSVMDFVPESPGSTPLSGSQFVTRFRGPADPLRRFWEKHSGTFPAYVAHLSGTVGRAFLLAPGSEERVLGSLVSLDPGHILFLPPIGNLFEWEQICNSLELLFRELQPEEEPLPGWLDSYSSERERALGTEAERLQQQLAATQAKVDVARSALRRQQRLKLLVSSSGATLEGCVMEALQELGIGVEPGPEAEDDLLLRFEGKTGTAEVKGISGSASQQHATQLEKWVSERILAGEEDVKGFLVVNAFRDRPLGERPEPVFPDNVVRYSTARGHCLIRTAQLLAILLELQLHPEMKLEIGRQLWSTVGVFQGYNDLLARLSP